MSFGQVSKLEMNVIIVPRRSTPLEPDTRMSDAQRLYKVRFNECFTDAVVV